MGKSKLALLLSFVIIITTLSPPTFAVESQLDVLLDGNPIDYTVEEVYQLQGDELVEFDGDFLQTSGDYTLVLSHDATTEQYVFTESVTTTGSALSIDIQSTDYSKLSIDDTAGRNLYEIGIPLDQQTEAWVESNHNDIKLPKNTYPYFIINLFDGNYYYGYMLGDQMDTNMYDLNSNLILQTSSNHSTVIHNPDSFMYIDEPINISEQLHVQDSYGNVLGFVNKMGISEELQIPMEIVIYDSNDNELSTYNYSPMEGTASTIDLSTMDEGNYKIAVRAEDEETLLFETPKVDVTFVKSTQNNSNDITGISYDKAEGFIEFTTGDYTYSDHNKIHINVNGEVVNGFSDPFDVSLLNNQNVRVVKVNENLSEEELMIDEVYGSIGNEAHPDTPKFSLDLFTEGGLGITSNTTYRIYIESNYAKEIMDLVFDHIYDSGRGDNFFIDIARELSYEWQDVQHGQVSLYGTVSNNDITPIDPYYFDVPNLVLNGEDIKIPIQLFNRNAQVNSIELVFEGELRDYAVTNLNTIPNVNVVSEYENNGLQSEVIGQDIVFTEEIYSSIQTYSYKVNNIGGLQDTNTLLFQPITGELESMVEDYMHQDMNNYRVYFIAKDVNEDIVGFEVFDQTENELKTDPELKFDTESMSLENTISLNENPIRIIEKYSIEEQNGEIVGYNNHWYDIVLSNTGLTNMERVLVNGTVSDTTGNTKEFVLTMHNWDGEGNFGGDFTLVPYKESWLNLAEGGLLVQNSQAQLDYRIAQDVEEYHEIPIFAGDKNTIELSFISEIEGEAVETTLEFVCYPESRVDIFKHDEDMQRQISGTSTTFEFELGEFYGDESKLSVEMLDENNQVVALFTSVLSSEEIIELESDEQGNTWEEISTEFIIGIGDDGFNNIGTLNDNDRLLVNLKYNDEYELPADEPHESLEFTYAMHGDVEVDNNSVTEVYVDYFGTTTIDSTNYNVLKVYLNDSVNIQNQTMSSFAIVDENDTYLSTAPSIMEAYRYDDYYDEDDPTNEVLLFYEESVDLNNNFLKVDYITDVAGNSMIEPVMQEIRISTEIDSYVTDEYGNIIADKELVLINKDELLDITEKILADQVFEYPHHEHLRINPDGKIRTSIEPGTYTVFEIRREESSDWIHDSSQDFDVTIPTMSFEQNTDNYWKYQEDIIVPSNNIEGNIYRSASYELEETLLFIQEGTISNKLMELRSSIESGNMTDEKWQALDFLYEHYIYEVKTDAYGNFEAAFAPGSYTLLGKVVGDDKNQIDEPSQPVTFTVEQGQSNQLTDITFEEPNMFVKIVDENGEAVRFSHITINGDNNFQMNVMTNEEGIIVGTFDPGTYIITKVESGWQSKGDGFIVGDNSESLTFTKTGETLEDVSIQLPASNTVIYFTVDGQPVQAEHSHINIEVLENNEYHGFGSASSRTGKYVGYLPEGSYQISGYHMNDASNDNLNQEFLVTSESSEIAIDLSGEFNAYVRLLDGEGNGLESYELDVYDETTGTWYGGKTNQEGIHYFNVDTSELPTEGTDIPVYGYSVNGKWMSFDNEKSIHIPKEATSTSRAALEIQLSAPNFRGSVVDEDGNKLFKDGWIHIENIDENYGFGNYIDWDGNFMFSIDEEGHYRVEGAGRDFEYMEISYDFQVVLENNKYVVKDMEGNIIPMPVSLTEVQPNLYGVVYKQGTTPYSTDGDFMSLLVKDADVDDETYYQRPWLYETWINMDLETGEFGTKIDPQKNYEAIAVATQEEFYSFASPVSLNLDEMNEVRPPAFLFNGVVKDYDGNLAVEGGIWVEKQDSFIGYHVGVSKDGSYGKNLETNTSYIIRDVNYKTASMEDWAYFNMNRELVINQEPVSMTIQPNVMGKIQLDELLTDEINYMGLHIIPVYESVDEFPSQDAEEYEKYLQSPWEFGFHTEAKKVEENGHNYAVFYNYLADGKYRLENIYIDNMHVEMNLDFELSGMDTEHVTYNNGKYLLEENYAPNVTGTLTEDGIPLADVWVNFISLKEDGTEDYNDYNRWFGTSTDENGIFRLNLDEGTYTLEGYNTLGKWVNNVWQNGRYVSINKKFKVNTEGTLLDMNGNPLENFDIITNVKGTVQYLDESNQYVDLNNAWLNIVKVDENNQPIWEESYWTHTGNNDNEFYLYLSPGNYMVTESGSDDVWFKDGQIFEVLESGSVLLEVKPEMPNLKGIAYLDGEMTNPLEWGWIAIKPDTADKHDWSQAIYLPTNKQGEFKENIPDGSWEIVEMGNYKRWLQLNMSFNVTDGTVSGLDMDEKGFVIAPPQPNVEGIVKDEDGNVVNDWAWIAIKPANADPYDWSEAIWAENKEIVDGVWGFELHLSNGDYKIVEVSGSNFWYRTDIPFTINNNVIDNLVATIPQPNVTGTVYIDAQGNELASNGHVGIIRIDENGNQVKHDGTSIPEDAYKDSYTGIYWEYGFGADIKEDGTFSIKLENGKYKVIAVGTEDTWYQANTVFEASDQVINVDVTKPAPNVTITITDVPNNLLADHAYLSLYRTTNGNKIYEDMELISVSGSSYTFQDMLPDGVYTIEFFASKSGEIILNQTFEVSSGQEIDETYSAWGENLAIVTGTITMDGSPVTNRVWLTIENTSTGDQQKVQTDETGQFIFVLEVGSEWRPVRIANELELRELQNTSSFTVTGDMNLGTINIVD